MVHKLDVQVYSHLPMQTAKRYFCVVCVCVCVCVLVSLQCMNEIVTLLNLTLFITFIHG